MHASRCADDRQTDAKLTLPAYARRMTRQKWLARHGNHVRSVGVRAITSACPAASIRSGRGVLMKRQTVWSKVKRIFSGRPVTHAEQQAARTKVMREPTSDAALNMHNSRFNGMGNSR